MDGNRAVPSEVWISISAMPASGEQGAQGNRVAKRERRAQGVRNAVPKQALQQGGHRRIAGGVIESVPNRHCKSATGPQDPPHLAQSRTTVLEEHQPELADDRIERTIGKGKLFRHPETPIDFGSLAAGNGEHALVAIEANNRTARLNTPRRFSRQNTGSACHIENFLARGELRRIRDSYSPTPERGQARKIPRRPPPRCASLDL